MQGEALLHKTYAARLLGGEAAAPAMVASLLRFMVDVAKMCKPFAMACRRPDFLESCVDLYFACVRYVLQPSQAGILIIKFSSLVSASVTISQTPNGNLLDGDQKRCCFWLRKFK